MGGLKLVVAGCVAAQEGETLLRRVPELDLVMGPHHANRCCMLSPHPALNPEPTRNAMVSRMCCGPHGATKCLSASGLGLIIQIVSEVHSDSALHITRPNTGPSQLTVTVRAS